MSQSQISTLMQSFLCLTVDPNKERREAVKRKTTQYLKRAEEIFISYLQDNISKGSTHLGVGDECAMTAYLFRLPLNMSLFGLSFLLL